jgi:diguanylate cyclase (GGDEF)-like protein
MHGASSDGSPERLQGGRQCCILSPKNLNFVENKLVRHDKKREARGLSGNRFAAYRLRDLGAAATLLAALLSAGPSAHAEGAGILRTITTAREAHDLSSQEARRGYPVHLRAVVTFYDPKAPNKRKGMTVHDATGSVFLRLDLGWAEPLAPGTLVDIRGVSALGEFAPIIDHPRFKIIRYSGFPSDVRRPTLAHMLTGADDGQWVEVEGVVHSVTDYGHYVMLRLAMADGDVAVKLLKDEGNNYSSLVDAKLRIQGNAQPIFNVSRQHMIGVRIECPQFSELRILEAPLQDPFMLPVTPIAKLMQWDMLSVRAHRVIVRGRVTLQWSGSQVCIQDATQGICAQTAQQTPIADGELIYIAGFAGAEGNAAVLSDAIFRRDTGSVAEPVKAEPVTEEQVLRGKHESQLIQIDGLLVSRDPASADTTLLLTAGKRSFTAILPEALGGPAAKAWENGSILRITGICLVQVDAQRTGVGLAEIPPKTFRILLRSPADVMVIQKASWWTPAHMVPLLALALCGTLVVLAWVMVLRKRIRESEERFRHMAQHDALTGLATRLLLEDRLNVALECAKRHHAGLVLLMLDIDHFKQINDTLGHHAGDEVLRVTAQRLLDAVRKSDTVARLGGDEFVVLLPELGDAEIAASLAAKIITALALPVAFAGRTMSVTVSIGVCASQAGELDADTLLKNVDAALYGAKAQGRNCFVVFADSQEDLR